MIINRMDLRRWSRGNPNCMYFDIRLHLVAQALLRVSHEYRVTGNGRYLAIEFNYQGTHRFFILQLDIIGLS